jgi:hypothetical protein
MLPHFGPSHRPRVRARLCPVLGGEPLCLVPVFHYRLPLPVRPPPPFPRSGGAGGRAPGSVVEGWTGHSFACCTAVGSVSPHASTGCTNRPG